MQSDFAIFDTCIKNNLCRGSEVKDIILGLNLLYLLVENRLSDFHCEVSIFSCMETEVLYVICSHL